jgi:diguanylate cyclase (GGDEF)-like protein
MPESLTLSIAGSKSSLFTPQEVESLMRIEFERARRYRHDVSCLMVQVDRLEQIHTVHGFEAKSEVFQKLVQLVKQATRTGDLLGYLTDDRLLCVFPHTSARDARGLCDRLLTSARDLIFKVGEGSVRVTLSVGLSHNGQSEEIGFDTLRRVAKEGLVVAQAGGGDRWAETELYDLCEAQQRRQEGSNAEPSTEGPGYREALVRMVEEEGDLEKAVSVLVEEMLDRAMSEARSDFELEQAEAQASRGDEDAPEFEEKEVAYQREIELLRRRVDKLSQSIGLSEQEIGRLRQSKDVDDGVASVYREVQGLSLDDARAELKKHLMSSIFEANLDLRQGRRTG